MKCDFYNFNMPVKVCKFTTMNIKHIHIITLCLLLFGLPEIHAQDFESTTIEKPLFIVNGSVLEDDTNKAIYKVNIEVVGGSYTTTNKAGDFRIQVREGDELIIRHKDFETVSHIVQNNERIKVLVKPSAKKFKKMRSKQQPSSTSFNRLIDSASSSMKTNPQKSVQFITEALEVSNSKKENAKAYEKLADIFFNLKQFDLAASNYETSLQNQTSNDRFLKLAKALEKNGNYQESIDVYSNRINAQNLSNWQKVERLEGLGDVYFAIKDYTKSNSFYNEGLVIANKHIITPKVTDLNSKIAQVYSASGAIEEAANSYGNSLRLAEKENKKRAVEEKVKVADFQNTNRAYDDEIELRKDALKDIKEIESEDMIMDNASPLTPQKQSYKIGNAYAAQENYPEAINYLEKSIEEADKKEDIIVQKDATRKLSELYRDIGDYKNALVAYQSYVELVDKLVVKKEQEISQASRFSRDITNKENRISSLETNKELSESKFALTEANNKRQRIVIYALIGGLLLLTLAAFLMYKNIKQQKFANNLLALKSLRSQMNPHFIFNALNSVNSFIATNDERTANKYLSDFSQLMRSVLENSEEDFIPLEKELELLELYTKLEHFRFQDKFDYAITVDENVNVKEFQIPPMLLQPYIENAVWHGLRYKKEKGQLSINIGQKEADSVAIVITDDGIGRDKSKALKTANQKKQNSKGMGNIKKRVAILNDMYHDKVDVFIDDYQQADDAGTKVVVTIKKD